VISVIVPVLRERQRLPVCLAALRPQARRHGAEIVVVDGGSDDGTRDVADMFPEVRWIDAPRGRGRQMNAGARVARGSLLVFLPADTVLPPNALTLLDRFDRERRPEAGGFRQRFDSPRRVLRLISTLHNLRAALTGVFYGDQVPFVRRELFLSLNGYREDTDMEDVEFGVRLRRRARPRQMALRVVTSSRRFDRAGDLRATAVAAGLLFSRAFLRRVPRSRTFFDPVR
jgi:rSAM/selenodomain-associated transferase 2